MGSLVWLEVAFEFKLKSTTIVFKGRASSIPSILLLMLCYIFVEWKSLINEWLLNMIKGPVQINISFTQYCCIGRKTKLKNLFLRCKNVWKFVEYSSKGSLVDNFESGNLRKVLFCLIVLCLVCIGLLIVHASKFVSFPQAFQKLGFNGLFLWLTVFFLIDGIFACTFSKMH